MNILRTGWILVAVLISVFVVWWNVSIHLTALPGSNEEQKQVDALLSSLGPRMHDDAPESMQRLFPEGEAFSFALYGLANCNAVRWCDPGSRSQHVNEARWALSELESNRVRSRFPVLLPPAHGIFHAGWSAYLHGKIVEAGGADNLLAEERAAYTRRCDTLASTFVHALTPFPESYNVMAWPADGTVAMAALALYDNVLPLRYTNVRRAWIQRVRRTILTDSGIAHEWDPATNTAKMQMRGSSLALMCMLLPTIDSTFANEQFDVFSHNFIDELLGVPVINEYPENAKGGGDVDSGPLIFGAGPVAMIVGAGACRVNGDAFHDLEMNSTVEGFGLPIGSAKRSYVLGAMPIADLFIAWCRSQPVNSKFEKPRPKFLRFHGYSAVLLLLIWTLVFYSRRKRNSARSEGKFNTPISL